jgi:sortase A
VFIFDALKLDSETEKRELILSTCWPFEALTSGPLRYVLHATMMTSVAAAPSESGL